MKSKFFNLLTASLATSVLLASAQQAFSHPVEYQTNRKEAQSISRNDEDSKGTDKEEIRGGLRQGDKASKRQESLPVAAASQTTQSTQAEAEQTAQLSNTMGGLFVTSALVAYVIVGLQYRKHRVHRATILLQQIEMLERIWKMSPQR
jgi:multidrug efflux pump subunit AcrB